MFHQVSDNHELDEDSDGDPIHRKGGSLASDSDQSEKDDLKSAITSLAQGRKVKSSTY